MGNELSTAKERTKSLKKAGKQENGSVSANITANGLAVDVKADTPVQLNGGPPSLDHPTETTDGPVEVKTDSEPAPIASAISDILETATNTEAVLETVNNKKDEVLEIVNNTKDEVLEIANDKKDEVLGIANDKKDEVLGIVNDKKDEVLEAVNKTDEVLEIVNDKKDEVLEIVNIKKEEVKKPKKTLFGMFKKKVDPPPEVPAAEVEENKGTNEKEESPPATEPEWDPSGQEAFTMIGGEPEYLCMKAERSTQTDRKTHAHISTQTGLDDESIASFQSRVEVVIETAAATEETFLSDSVVVIGEEAIELTANADASVPGVIFEEVVIMEDSVYENIVFEVERVELTESVAHGEIAIQQETPFAASSSLPTAVSGCAEVVFAASSESAYFVAVDTSKAFVHRDNDKSPGDIVVSYNALEGNCISTPEEEPLTLEMEPILGFATPASQLNPVELSFPPVTEIQVMAGSACEVIAADYEVVSYGDEPGPSEQEKLTPVSDDESLQKSDSDPETINSIVAPYIRLITIEELPEETPNVVASTGLEASEEAEPSPVIFEGDAEGVPMAAIDALALNFATIAITTEEPEIDFCLKEEVIIPTTCIPLSGEQEAGLTIQEVQCETIVEVIKEEATESLLTGIEAMPEVVVVEVNTTLQVECMETTEQIPNISTYLDQVEEIPSLCEDETVISKLENMPESVGEAMLERLEVTESIAEEPTDGQEEKLLINANEELKSSVTVQEELVEKVNPTVQELLEDASNETAGPSVVSVESIVPTDSNPSILEKPTEENLPEQQTKTEGLMVKFENKFKTVAEAISEKFEAVEHIFEGSSHEQENVQQIDATEDSEPCISIQQGFEEENSTLVGVHLEEDVQETAEVAEECIEETDLNTVVSAEPAEESPSLLAQQPITTGFVVKFENLMESVVEAVSDKLDLTGSMAKEPADDQGNVPQVDATEEFEPCVSVQEVLVEVHIPPVEMLSEDIDKETAIAPVDEVDTAKSNPVLSDELEDSTALLMQQTEDKNPDVENTLESVDKAASATLEVTENIVVELVDDQANVPQMETMENLLLSLPPSVEKVTCIEIQKPIIAEKPVVDTPSLPEPQPKTEVLESVVEDYSEKLEVNVNVVKEPVGVQVQVPQLDASGESEPCASIQESVLEENVALVEALLEEACEETASASLSSECIELPNLNPAEESSSLLEEQPETKELTMKSENTLESVVDVVLENPEVSENIVVKSALEQTDVPLVDANLESVPCASIQEVLLEENVAPVEALLEEACEETASSSLVQLPNLIPVISEESAEESSSLFQQQPATKMFTIKSKDTLESVVEVVFQRPEVAESVVLESVLEETDVPPVDANEEPEPCVSAQEELVVEVPLEDALKETVAPSIVAVECIELTDVHNVLSSESAEEHATLLEREPKTEGLLVQLENKQGSSVQVISGEFEVTEHKVERQADVPGMDATGDLKPLVSVQEDLVEDVLNPVISENNPRHHEEQPKTDEDSQLAASEEVVSECVDAVCDNIVEEIITEHIAAECNLVTSEVVVAQEINAGGQTGVNSADFTLDSQSEGMIEDSSATSTAMKDLLVSLQSACTSVVAESAYELSGLETSSLGYSITVTIYIGPNEER